MDRAFTPPAFNMVGRLSALLNALFVCFVYSSALPIMLPIAAVTFTLQFWVDKVSLGARCP